MTFDRQADAPSWQFSIRGVMLGVLIAALYFAEESRLVLFVLAYILLPILFVLMMGTRRGRGMAIRYPGTRRLVAVSTAFTLIGWCLFLAVLPAVGTAELYFPMIGVVLRGLILLPVVLFGLVVWRLLTFPRMEWRSA